MVAIIFTPLNSGGGGLKVYEDGFRADRGGRVFLPIFPECRKDLYPVNAGDTISPMERQPTLMTDRLILRLFDLADAPEVQRLAGDYAIAAATLLPHPYPDGLAEIWIASLRRGVEDGNAAAFAVTLAPERNLIGSIRLRIDEDLACGEAGFWIGKPYWGRGYATEATLAVIEYGFSSLGLHRIYGIHFSRNPASGRVMEKCRMVYEGRLRRRIRRWGVLEDADVWGAFRDEWL